LAIDHRLGWSAVPSNNFTVQREGDSLLLRGVGNGHGIGLCQAGAKAMAEAGAGYQEILDHYYPNANIVSYLRSNRP
jgi:stage II sporulation protein D